MSCIHHWHNRAGANTDSQTSRYPIRTDQRLLLYIQERRNVHAIICGIHSFIKHVSAAFDAVFCNGC
jgi:hypothetical protein